MGGNTAKKLTLESYMDFSADPNRYPLTRHQINQIIYMHGFIKLYNISKNNFMERLGTIENLLSPIRSTLKENTSSSALLGLEEVNEDLLSLQWNECSVQSVETVGLVKEKENEKEKGIGKGTSCGDRDLLIGYGSLGKRTRKRSRKAVPSTTITDLVPATTITDLSPPALSNGSW